jgi:hypothetical protein
VAIGEVERSPVHVHRDDVVAEVEDVAVRYEERRVPARLEPTRSAIPRMRAGSSVIAASALSGGRPFLSGRGFYTRQLRNSEKEKP